MTNVSFSLTLLLGFYIPTHLVLHNNTGIAEQNNQKTGKKLLGVFFENKKNLCLQKFL